MNKDFGGGARAARVAGGGSGGRQMGRLAVALVVLVAAFLHGACSKSVLEEFFQGREYATSVHELSDKVLYFSCSWVEEEKQIWDKAMLYQKKGGRVEPLLTVDDEMRIYNSRELIASPEWPTPTFYGWEAEISADDRNEYVYFRIVPFADMGKSTTDGILFLWDYENHVYKKWEPDWSQM